MILRRLTTAFREQDWFTVGVDSLRRPPAIPIAHGT